jgi:hypothetical protein
MSSLWKVERPAQVMARVPYLDPSDLPAEHKDLLARNLNLFRVMVHSRRAI